MPLAGITPFASFTQRDRVFIANTLLSAQANEHESRLIVKVPDEISKKALSYLQKNLPKGSKIEEK